VEAAATGRFDGGMPGWLGAPAQAAFHRAAFPSRRQSPS
jgi:hypothetical protein